MKKQQSLNEKYDYRDGQEVMTDYNCLCLQLDYEHRKYLNNATVEELSLWHNEFLQRYQKLQKQFSEDFKTYIENKGK